MFDENVFFVLFVEQSGRINSRLSRIALLYSLPAALSNVMLVLTRRRVSFSRKAKELVNFPHAAITFWWGALSRSVRFEGTVSKISAEESDAYYSSRPTGSKVRSVCPSRAELSEMGASVVACCHISVPCLCGRL